MASNFKITFNRRRDHLNIKLMGDFDGNSAYELLNLMKNNCNGIAKVFIHTSGLKHIYPFGRDTFLNNLSLLNNPTIQFLFTGEKADKIAPEEWKVIQGL